MIHVIIGLLQGGLGALPHALPAPQMIIQILGGAGHSTVPTLPATP